MFRFSILFIISTLFSSPSGYASRLHGLEVADLVSYAHSQKQKAEGFSSDAILEMNAKAGLRSAEMGKRVKEIVATLDREFNEFLAINLKGVDPVDQAYGLLLMAQKKLDTGEIYLAKKFLKQSTFLEPLHFTDMDRAFSKRLWARVASELGSQSNALLHLGQTYSFLRRLDDEEVLKIRQLKRDILKKQATQYTGSENLIGLRQVREELNILRSQGVDRIDQALRGIDRVIRDFEARLGVAATVESIAGVGSSALSLGGASVGKATHTKRVSAPIGISPIVERADVAVREALEVSAASAAVSDAADGTSKFALARRGFRGASPAPSSSLGVGRLEGFTLDAPVARLRSGKTVSSEKTRSASIAGNGASASEVADYRRERQKRRRRQGRSSSAMRSTVPGVPPTVPDVSPIVPGFPKTGRFAEGVPSPKAVGALAGAGGGTYAGAGRGRKQKKALPDRRVVAVASAGYSSDSSSGLSSSSDEGPSSSGGSTSRRRRGGNRQAKRTTLSRYVRDAGAVKKGLEAVPKELRGAVPDMFLRAKKLGSVVAEFKKLR